MPSNGVLTDFSQYSLAQLSQMLDQSDPTSCQNAAETWDSTGQQLSEQVQNLQVQLSSLNSAWTGTAATDYKKMLTDLVGGIQKVANNAFTMRDLMYEAFDALTNARAQMPATGSATVSPDTLTLATTPIPYGQYLSPQAASELEQQQAAAQLAVAAATSAQAKAVAVMQALAGSYVTAQAGIPPSPNGSVPGSTTSASSATSGAGASALAGASGALLAPGSPGTTTSFTVTTTDAQSSALFGDMFTIGLAAAAAVAGSTGLLMPSGLASAKTSSNSAQGDSNTASPGEDAGAAGAGGDADVPVPDPGTGTDAGQAANLASNAADAAASGASSEPMMPMMPMGGMGPGMGDSGGSRRIPSWLVEHQDVWGASVRAAPGLISE
jgi:uncharacterized protein YukE